MGIKNEKKTKCNNINVETQLAINFIIHIQHFITTAKKHTKVSFLKIH